MFGGGTKEHLTDISAVCIWLNALRPIQNRRHFPDDIFKCMFVNENVWTSIKQIHWSLLLSIQYSGIGSDNGLLMVSLLTDIYVTRPQSVKGTISAIHFFSRRLFESYKTCTTYLEDWFQFWTIYNISHRTVHTDLLHFVLSWLYYQFLWLQIISTKSSVVVPQVIIMTTSITPMMTMVAT